MVISRLLSELALGLSLIAHVTIASTHTNHGGISRTVIDRATGESARSGNEFGNASTVLSGAYIIELDSEASTLEGRADGNAHANFHKRAAERGLDYKVRYDFTDDTLFHGLSIDVSGDADRETLKRMPGVKKVWPIVKVSRPKPFDMGLNVSGVSRPLEGYSTDIIRDKDYTVDGNLKMASVDYLHSRGHRGKGVKIAILDSGIDYNHPALGRGFGPGKKVAFGRNYFPDDGEGGPDDPIALCVGGSHGTHVAGIIGGEDPQDYGFGLLGVAPDATLGMYRIFPCEGDVGLDVWIQAWIDACNDGADIISASIGWAVDHGFEDANPLDQVITNTKKRGVISIISAGNDGFGGPMYISPPAISKDAIAGGSIDAAMHPTTYKMGSTTSREEWRYSSLWPLEGEFHVYAPSDEGLVDGCAPDSAERAATEVAERGWNVTETLALLRFSGDCYFGSVVQSVLDEGFRGIIAWIPDDDGNPSNKDYPGTNFMYISIGVNHVDGKSLYKAATDKSTEFKAVFKDKRFKPIDNYGAGFTSNFSSFGNTWEYDVFKPDLMAPGRSILSTVQLKYGGYAIYQGTSMASPFIAGCFALMKEVFPDFTWDEISNLLRSTAEPGKWWGDTEITHTASQQGAGTIHVWNAYNSGTRFAETTVVVGATSRPVEKNITFTNTLGRSKTFEITHIPAGLVQRTPYPDLEVVDWRVYGFPSKPIYAEVDFKSPTTVTLKPGESTSVSIVVTPPSGLDPDTIPQYSGYIRFVSGRDVYNVPYQGLTYNISDIPVLERDILPNLPQLPAMAKWDESAGDYEFVDEDIVTYNTAAGEEPNIVFFARQPSYNQRIDLVAANTTFKPTYHGFNSSSDLNTTTPKLPIVDDFGGAESFGQIYSVLYEMPLYREIAWWGGLDNEEGEPELVPEGDYRFLLRVLPVKSDAEDPDDWESWLGPVIRIVS